MALPGKQMSRKEIWVQAAHECCRRTIDDGSSDLTKGQRDLLMRLQELPIIPSKQIQFTNFIKHARRGEPEENIDFVWKILRKAQLDFKAKNLAERAAAEEEEWKARQLKAEEENGSIDVSDSSNDEIKSQNGGVKNSEGSQPKQKKAVVAINGKKAKLRKRWMSESESGINESSDFIKLRSPQQIPGVKKAKIHLTSTVQSKRMLRPRRTGQSENGKLNETLDPDQ